MISILFSLPANQSILDVLFCYFPIRFLFRKIIELRKYFDATHILFKISNRMFWIFNKSLISNVRNRTHLSQVGQEWKEKNKCNLCSFCILFRSFSYTDRSFSYTDRSFLQSLSNIGHLVTNDIVFKSCKK